MWKLFPGRILKQNANTDKLPWFQAVLRTVGPVIINTTVGFDIIFFPDKCEK